MNGPLQQRTLILNLDSSRATSFPENYDTDVEYEWSNLSERRIQMNAFVNG